MQKCPSCGYEADKQAMRCPECGSFYSKIIELIEQEAEDEARYRLKSRLRRVFQADNKKQAVKLEFEQLSAGLTLKAKLALWVIFVFVFALIVTVV
ncbi:MAG: hypothetical protein WAW36_16665 [Methylovulum miyakonense]|uniref:hypothetical protein n=1 Tax=Methylovulum miyakonense TaxID=645578 RepID=UPI003BB7C1B8